MFLVGGGLCRYDVIIPLALECKDEKSTEG